MDRTHFPVHGVPGNRHLSSDITFHGCYLATVSANYSQQRPSIKPTVHHARSTGQHLSKRPVRKEVRSQSGFFDKTARSEEISNLQNPSSSSGVEGLSGVATAALLIWQVPEGDGQWSRWSIPAMTMHGVGLCSRRRIV